MRKLLFINYKGFYIRALVEGIPSTLPVAVLRDGVVLEASEAAQARGVTAGIGKTLGQRRCPELALVEFDSNRCHALYEQVWSLFADLTPQVEPTALHQGYLDLTGCECAGRTLATLIHAASARLQGLLHINCEWGGGQDRWIAKLACGENVFVAPAEEQKFLARVPLRRLLPDELCARLLRYSVRTVTDLLTLPRHFIETHLQLSPQQIRPYLLRDTASVKCLFPPPCIAAEVEIEWVQAEQLAAALDVLAEDAARQLRESGLEAGALRATFTATHRREFHEIVSSRPLHSAGQIRHMLEAFILDRQLRRLQRIRVELNRLAPRARKQTDLWHDPTKQMEQSDRLRLAQETVRRRHGGTVLQSGSEAAARLRPRFAQLIYAQRGIYLP